MGVIEQAVRGRKVRPQSARSARRDDFELAGAREVDAARLLEPDVTPYCLDFERRELVCVTTPPGAALGEAAFFYQAQRDLALSLIAVPFDLLARMAMLPEPSPALIFSPGRCGSTLLHRAFVALGVPSVSEPEVFAQLADHVEQQRPRHIDRAKLDDGVRVLRKSTGMLLAGLDAGPGRTMIKLHMTCNLAPLAIARAFPEVKLIFLLREQLAWAESMWRVAPRISADRLASWLHTAVVALAKLKKCYPRRTRLCYYEDLRGLDAGIMGGLLSFAGWDPGLASAERLAAIAERDSQAATRYSRDALAGRSMPGPLRAEFERLWGQRRDAALIAELGLRGV
jgi:hypothetical protein